jgi:hypothetical protein
MEVFMKDKSLLNEHSGSMIKTYRQHMGSTIAFQTIDQTKYEDIIQTD